MKPNTLTPREIEIVDNATGYSTTVRFKDRQTHNTEAEGRARCEAAGSGCLYATAELGGVPAGALLATYKASTGWVSLARES